MADNQPAQATQPPRPDPALKRLERFVGTWEVNGPHAGLRGGQHLRTFRLPVAAWRLLPATAHRAQLRGLRGQGPGGHRLRPGHRPVPLDCLLEHERGPDPLRIRRAGRSRHHQDGTQRRGDLHGHLQQGRQLRVGWLEAGRGRRPWQRRLRHHCDPSQLSWCSDSTPSHGVGVSRPPAQRERSLHGRTF
jgi:hypothetical protein